MLRSYVDVVLLRDVIERHNLSQPQVLRWLVVGILAKNRQGLRGRLALEFTGSVQRWDESQADVSRRGKARA